MHTMSTWFWHKNQVWQEDPLPTPSLPEESRDGAPPDAIPTVVEDRQSRLPVRQLPVVRFHHGRFAK
jgi:hypothetical protein